MIGIDETRDELIRMLAEQEFDFEHPDAVLAWKVFQDFSKVKVKCGEDALLFECGTYDFTGEELFSVDFARQFIPDEDEGFDIFQLRLILYYPPAAELDELGAVYWSFDYEADEEFFRDVERADEFKIPVWNLAPVKAAVTFENAE